MSAREKQATPKAAFVFLALINEQTFAEQIESTIVRVCESKLSKVATLSKHKRGKSDGKRKKGN